MQNMEDDSKDLQNASTQHMLTPRKSYLWDQFHYHVHIKLKLFIAVQQKKLHYPLVLFGATVVDFAHIQRW